MTNCSMYCKTYCGKGRNSKHKNNYCYSEKQFLWCHQFYPFGYLFGISGGISVIVFQDVLSEKRPKEFFS